MNIFKIVMCSSVIFLSGCVIGTKIDYSTGYIEFDSFSFDQTGGCSILVLDERPYVLSHDKNEDFVGLRRGGYGNPFNVTTESGQPLSDDLTMLFTESYNNVLDSTCDSGESTARKEVVYMLKEWKTDFMVRGWFYYDIDMLINIDGLEVVDENVNGKLVLDSNFLLPNAMVQVINELHAKPDIALAMEQ